MLQETTPEYGSQEYWQERYRKPSDHHSWYFTYQELRPILLPLILGSETMDADEEVEIASSNSESNIARVAKRPKVSHTDSTLPTKDDGNETTSGNHKQDDTQQNSDPGRGGNISDCNDDEEQTHHGEDTEESHGDDSFVEVDDDDGDEDDASETEINRGHGLVKNGPVSVLEIGCGDVPLGIDFARDLAQLSTSAEDERSRNMVLHIRCIDYSQVVVERLRRDYACQNDEMSIRLEFETMDARKLTAYDDESYGLVMDKGTLDAMISDKKTGVESCIQIVAESSRVLTSPGYLVLVSHYNASEDKGLHWLQEIVYPGLLQSGIASSFQVECHGHPDGGPAVYVIRKEMHKNDDNVPLEESSDGANFVATIPIQFYNYS